MKLAVSLLFTLVMLAGCASSGTEMQKSDLQSIQVGVTTYSDMESMFGAPVSQAYNGNGLLTASWMHIFVGPFGVGTEQQMLSAVFNEDKTVRQYNVSQSGRKLWGSSEESPD